MLKMTSNSWSMFLTNVKFTKRYSSIKRYWKKGLEPFEADPVPTAEDMWKPRIGLHFPEQYYGLYAHQMPVKSYRITKFHRKRPFHAMPNVKERELYSELLGKSFTIKTTPVALMLIEKFGGLDNYLLKNSLDEINSYVGVDIRKLLLKELEKRGLWDPEKEAKRRMAERNKLLTFLPRRIK